MLANLSECDRIAEKVENAPWRARDGRGLAVIWEIPIEGPRNRSRIIAEAHGGRGHEFIWEMSVPNGRGRERKGEAMWSTNRQRFHRVMSPSADLVSRRALAGKLISLGVALVALFAGGCRAHPGSLATLVAGDAINDLDVKNRRGKLMGRDETAADKMFGARLETLDDVERRGVSIIFYPVQFDLLKSSRYIVELDGGVIVVFAKTKRNIDGIEDLIHDKNLERKLIGKTPAQCSRDGDLGAPLRTLRSREKGQLLRVYDIRHWSDFMGARYCLLRFGSGDRCEDVTLMGVSASTKKDPMKR